MHSISGCIHKTDEVLAQIRIVIVHIAAVEICYEPVECGLVLLTKPTYELLAGILGEGPVLVYCQHCVHHGFDRLGAQYAVYKGCNRAGDSPHEVGGCQGPVPKTAQALLLCLRTVFYTCRLYHVANMHV